MANITARKDTRRQPGEILAYPVGDDENIPEGALVARDATGYAINADDVIGQVLLGVAHVGFDNTDGSDGDGNVQVWANGVFDFVYGGTADATTVGTLVYAIDNQTVDAAGVGTTDLKVGRVVEVLSASKVRVAIDPDGSVSA